MVRLKLAVISVNVELITLLITSVQLIALCFSIDFCLLGEKKLIACNKHKLIECPDYEVQCES